MDFNYNITEVLKCSFMLGSNKSKMHVEVSRIIL